MVLKYPCPYDDPKGPNSSKVASTPCVWCIRAHLDGWIQQMYQLGDGKIDIKQMTEKEMIPQFQVMFNYPNIYPSPEVVRLRDLRVRVENMYVRNLNATHTKQEIESNQEYHGGQWPLASDYEAIAKGGKVRYDVPQSQRDLYEECVNWGNAMNSTKKTTVTYDPQILNFDK